MNALCNFKLWNLPTVDLHDLGINALYFLKFSSIRKSMYIQAVEINVLLSFHGQYLAKN